MHFSHYFLVILALLVSMFLIIFINTDFTTEARQQNAEYTSYLKSATKAGVSAAMDHSQDGRLFGTQTGREAAVAAYYETLIKCFNYDNAPLYAEQVKYYTPCIFLIDNDGYYVNYTADYTDATGHSASNDIITPINKWVKSYKKAASVPACNVEFHLDDTITVIYDNAQYAGNYDEVYKMIRDPRAGRGSESALPADPFSDRTKFRNEKTELIISDLQDKLEYYVNVHDAVFNQKNDVQYQFTLPRITGENWGRLIDQPTILSFLQGIQVLHQEGFLNVYSFSGNEITEERLYYIQRDTSSGIAYYHRKGCGRLTLPGSQLKPYTMEEAAKHGAFPCPDCVR